MSKEALKIGVDLGTEKDEQCAVIILHYDGIDHIIYETHDKEQIEALNKIKQQEAIDNANPSEALECLEWVSHELKTYYEHLYIILLDSKEELISKKKKANEYLEHIKQALLKAQEPKKYVDELKLVEKKLKALDLLMQELDCKEFAELRKYARCGYEKLNSNNFKGSKEFKIEIPESSLMDYNPVKQYLKWEDLEFEEKAIYKRVTLNGGLYLLKTYRNFILDFDIVELEKNDGTVLFHINQHNLQFFNDLKLEVEE